MDTYFEFQDAEKQMVKVMDSVFLMDNLLASEFLNASVKVEKIPSEILQDRSEGIMFFWFDCKIDPTQ